MNSTFLLSVAISRLQGLTNALVVSLQVCVCVCVCVCEILALCTVLFYTVYSQNCLTIGLKITKTILLCLTGSRQNIFFGRDVYILYSGGQNQKVNTDTPVVIKQCVQPAGIIA